MRVGEERGREDLAERRVSAAPAGAHEDQQRLELRGQGRVCLDPPAARTAANQDQRRDSLGVTGGVGGGHRRALRDGDDRRPLDAGRVEHRSRIGDEVLERDRGRRPVRPAIAAGVVANEAVAAAEQVEPVRPHRNLQVVIQVAEPVGRLRDRRARAEDGVGEPHAVGAAALVVALIHRPDAPQSPRAAGYRGRGESTARSSCIDGNRAAGSRARPRSSAGAGQAHLLVRGERRRRHHTGRGRGDQLLHRSPANGAVPNSARHMLTQKLN